MTDGAKWRIPSRSTREQRIRGLVEDWRARLNLRDWQIEYDPTLDSPGSWATIDSRSIERVAAMSVAADTPDDSLEITVVHELLHIVLEPLGDVAGRLIAQIKDPAAQAVLSETHEEALERAIETIALALLPKAKRLTVGEGEPWAHWGMFR